MTKFGRTWWGEQWLHALDRIDFDSRLERGRRYAKNGSVLSVKISGNQVEEKVQGSQQKPYLKNDSLHPELSGKTILLLQLLETIYENNEKVLIFSQFREMGDILRQIIHNHFGKKALANLAVSSGEKWIGDLSDKAIKQLVNLGES